MDPDAGHKELIASLEENRRFIAWIFAGIRILRTDNHLWRVD